MKQCEYLHSSKQKTNLYTNTSPWQPLTTQPRPSQMNQHKLNNTKETFAIGNPDSVIPAHNLPTATECHFDFSNQTRQHVAINLHTSSAESHMKKKIKKRGKYTYTNSPIWIEIK